MNKILHQIFFTVLRMGLLILELFLRLELERNRLKATNQLTQQAITCSKLTIETLEQVVKYVQS